MAFTIEEIDKALTTQNHQWPLHVNGDEGLQQSVNYPLITNYLTGRSQTLNGIQHDDKIYSWSALINLLEDDIETISPKQQLLLDVIYEPMLFPFISFNFNHWLLRYIFHKKTTSVFQAALLQFRKQGMTDDAIFQFLIFSFEYDEDNEPLPSNEPLMQFLKAHIQGSKNLIYPSHGFIAWNNEWSLFYFKLLEETKPEFAKEYLLYGMQSDRSNPVIFFTAYKNGKYMPDILSFLTDLKNTDLKTLQLKFASALRLYEADQQKYSGLALELAKLYLDGFGNNNPQQHWEGGFSMSSFEDTDLNYMGYSSCAFHLLFLHDRETALQKINEWLQQKVFIHIKTVKLLYHHLKQEVFPYYETVLATEAAKGARGGIEYFRYFIGFIQEHFEPAQYLPLVWQLINSKSKPLREFVAAIIAKNDTQAEHTAISLLENKNAETRQTAALILSHISTAGAKDAIMKILNTETNDNARDILLQTVADN